MPTDTAPASALARNFALRFGAWSLGVFGVLRLNWVEAQAVLPVTQLQGQLAWRLSGASVFPIDVTLACSGTDVLAVCLGAILAYPARWRIRLAGAGAGLLLLLVLNTLRIGTLGHVVAVRPSWFEVLHVYVWPAVLLLAAAGYVFTWMRFADNGHAVEAAPAAKADQSVRQTTGLTRRFVWLTAACLALFTAASPLYLESDRVLSVAAFIARAGALSLRLLGVDATASSNALWTTRGNFLVTQECIFTPLIPVYLAAVFAYSHTWRRRALTLSAALPLFVGLGIARLLVVALPAALVDSPIVVIHAFYQLLLAGVIVSVAAVWRHGAGATAWRRALVGAALGGVCVYLLGPPYTRALTSAFSASTPLADPQGAITLLPTFQVWLYIALSMVVLVGVKWQPFVAGLAMLGLSQVAVFAALHFVARHADLAPHVRDVRGWAIAGPLIVVAAIVRYERPRR